VTTRASGPSGGPDNFDLLTPHFPEILHLIVSQKVPICHPELVSGFLNSLILLDAELGSASNKKRSIETLNHVQDDKRPMKSKPNMGRINL
jgi:hypothetical protein